MGHVYKVGDKVVWSAQPGVVFLITDLPDGYDTPCANLMSLDGRCKKHKVMVERLKPWVEPFPRDTQPCCAEGNLEPQFPGMIYIPEGYVAEITIEAGLGYTPVSGIVWVKESRVLMVRKVSE
jgi:hypothetical protein